MDLFLGNLNNGLLLDTHLRGSDKYMEVFLIVHQKCLFQPFFQEQF